MKTKNPKNRCFFAIPGLALVLAGSLKFHAMMTAYSASETSDTVALFLAEVEFLAGLWLIAGFYRERARLWAVAIFGGLWVANLYQILAGRCSCGCFGVLMINPWFVLVTLLRWHDSMGDNGEIPTNPLEFFIISFTFLAIVFVGIQKQALTVLAGTATRNGQALSETMIVLRGGSIEFSLVTDRHGSFRSPPIRPGQYSLSIKKPQAISGAPTDASNQASISSNIEKPGHNLRSGPGSKKIPQKALNRLSLLAHRYDNIEILSVDLNECQKGIYNFDFK